MEDVSTKANIIILSSAKQIKLYATKKTIKPKHFDFAIRGFRGRLIGLGFTKQNTTRVTTQLKQHLHSIVSDPDIYDGMMREVLQELETDEDRKRFATMYDNSTEQAHRLYGE